MSLIRRISLSFVFIMLGSFLAYLFRRMLAVHLSVSDYGLIYAMIGFFSFFMLFIDLGLEQAATKYIVESQVKNNIDTIKSIAFSVLGFQLVCSAIFLIIVYLFSQQLATYYFHTASAAEYLIMLGVWFCTSPLIMFISYILLGFERTTWYTAVDFFRMVILCTGTILLFMWGKGIYAPLIMYAIVNIILFCVYLPYVLSFFPKIFKYTHLFSYTQFKEVFSYGILIALTSFGWVIITQTDILMLTYFTTTYEVGLYAIALPISLLLLFVMRPINIVFAPLVAKYAVEKKEKELSQTIATAYKYAFILLLPVVLCFVMFPDMIISILFSQEYSTAARALQILACGTLFYAFSLFNSIIFNGLGKAKIMAKVVAIISVVNIILNAILIPIYSIAGAAIATSVSYVLLFIISTMYEMRYITMEFPIISWVKAIISLAITFVLIFILKNYLVWNNLWEVIVCSGVLFIVYILQLFAFKTINPTEMRKWFS